MLSENGGMGACPQNVGARYLQKKKVIVLIIDHHAKKNLIPQRSYADVSFLLLQACTPMLEAKQFRASRSKKKKLRTPGMHMTFAEGKREKCPIPPKGSSPTRLPTSSLQCSSEAKN